MNGKGKEMLQKNETVLWIERTVRDFLSHSPENTLRNQAKDRAFEEVVIGFSKGDDPLYPLFRKDFDKIPDFKGFRDDADYL